MNTRLLTALGLSLGIAGPVWAQTKVIMPPPSSFLMIPSTEKQIQGRSPVWVSAQWVHEGLDFSFGSLEKGILKIGDFSQYGPFDSAINGLRIQAIKSAVNLENLISALKKQKKKDQKLVQLTKNLEQKKSGSHAAHVTAKALADVTQKYDSKIGVAERKLGNSKKTAEFLSTLGPFLKQLDVAPVSADSRSALAESSTKGAIGTLWQGGLELPAERAGAMASSFVPGASIVGAWAGNDVWKNHIKPVVDKRQEDVLYKMKQDAIDIAFRAYLTLQQVMDDQGNVLVLGRDEYFDPGKSVINRRSADERKKFEQVKKELRSQRRRWEELKEGYQAGKINDEVMSMTYEAQDPLLYQKILASSSPAAQAIASRQGLQSVVSGKAQQAPVQLPVSLGQPSSHIAHLPPFSLPAALPMVTLGSAQYAGMITTAKEATLALMGPLSAADSARVEQRWAGFYAFPADNILQYFRKATPLLTELLNVREAIALTATAFDNTWAEASAAAEYDNQAYAEALLAQAILLKDYLVALEARARMIAQALQNLGEPPDALAAQDAASNVHRKATDTLLDLLKPTDGHEGIWYGVMVDEEGVFIDGITESPLVFVVYSVGPPANKRYRALTLDADTYDEKTDPYIDVLEMHEDQDTPLPALYPHMKNGQISKSFDITEVDEEDGETYSWSITIKANVLGADGVVQYPAGASMERAQKAAQETLAASAKRKKEEAKQGSSDRSMDLGAMMASNVLGNKVSEMMVQSQLEDLRRHHELTPAFVAAAKKWLKERPFSEDSTLEEDRKQLSSIVASFVGPAKGGKTAAKPVPIDSAASTQKADDDRKAEEQALLDRIKFHQHNIRFVEANLAKDRAELAKEADPQRRAALELRIIGELSDIQSEKDLIASIETGRLVRTRSPFDDYAHDALIANIHETHQKMAQFQRNTESLLRLAAMLPGSEGQSAREFVERQLTPEVRTRMDEGAVKKIASAIGKKVEGYYQGQQAKDEEDAALANLGLEAAQNVKTAADYGMMATSLFGGQAIDSTYQGLTGYIEGGPAEAALRTVSSFGPLADGAVETLRGYREGGLEQAIEQGSWAVIKGGLLQYGAGKILARTKAGRANVDGAPTSKAAIDGAPRTKAAIDGAPRTKAAIDGAPASKTFDGDTGPGPARPTAFEREALEQFKRARKQGEDLVQDMRNAQQRLADAGSAGRPAEELLELQRQVREKVLNVNGNPNAKNYLKYKGDPQTQRTYVLHLEDVHGKVKTEFDANQNAKGWNQQDLKEMRNAASAGSVGMDYDIGLDETAMKSLTKNGEPAMLYNWQNDAQQSWNDAYAKVTGKSAPQAWESVTTSKHAESYRDKAWLGADKSKVSKAWGQQAADVTLYKTSHMMHDAEGLSYFERLQEVSRGAAKDFDTKVTPMLDRIKPGAGGVDSFKASRAHWEKISKVMSDFGKNNIDPITADRTIRSLTGGKDIPQVISEMGTLLEAAIKFGPGA